MTDRLTRSEIQQIANHRPSCGCDLCTRHRRWIGFEMTEHERQLLEVAEQMVEENNFSGDYPSWMTTEEIDRARRYLSPARFQQEYEAQFEPPQIRPRVLMLAGSLRDAETFVRQYQGQYPSTIFRYLRTPDDLRGLCPDSSRLIRVGRWQDSLLARNFTPDLDSTFPDWRSSPEYLRVDHQNAWIRILRLDPAIQEQLQREIQETVRETVEMRRQRATQELRDCGYLEPEVQPGHSCVTCCYLLRGNPSICNAFHDLTGRILSEANDCADWQGRDNHHSSTIAEVLHQETVEVRDFMGGVQHVPRVYYTPGTLLSRMNDELEGSLRCYIGQVITPTLLSQIEIVVYQKTREWLRRGWLLHLPRAILNLDHLGQLNLSFAPILETLIPFVEVQDGRED